MNVTLSDVVGQPSTRHLQALAAEPAQTCLLFEGPPGCGKTMSAHALAHELGCHDEFTGKWVVNCADFSVDAARELFGRTLRLRWGSSSGFTVLIAEELEWISPQCQRYLKSALDPLGTMPGKLIVAATSNGAAGLDEALLDRFEIYPFSTGPSFQEACQDELNAQWANETDDAPLPPEWQSWGTLGEGYTMRRALRDFNRSLKTFQGHSIRLHEGAVA